MKQLKPIQLFESYEGNGMVVISDIDSHELWRHSDVYKFGSDSILIMALSRILNLPITGVLGYELDNAQYPDEEIIIYTIIYLNDTHFIDTHGVHKLSSNDPSVVDEYLNDDGYMYHSMYFKTISEMDIIIYRMGYLTEQKQQQNEVQRIVTDAVETITTECSFISKIYEFCLKNNIDIGLSDDVKNIAGAAMKGNHKLR